ncbi:GSCOCG00011493001-RA-CDS [Cotesia congregata]|nr:GSCOCG00011493001-RA-CDS [Cotesia congregata]
MPDAHVPLIAKRDVTAKDHILSAIALSVRHRWTYESTMDHLKLLKSVYHHNSIPTTKEQLWKCLDRHDNLLEYHYYCQKCRDYLGLKNLATNKLQKECKCGTCGPDDELESDLNYFIYINLTAQIKELLSLPDISESLRYRFWRTKNDPNGYEDIYDGDEYKALSAPGKLLEKWYNFSFTINTDGCNVSKSSNSSAWPVYAEINELPPHLRKKHMLLAAIFIDGEHPIMNNYFRPFTSEMQLLFTEGIKWNPPNSHEITSRFIVTTCTLDSPARAAVVCMKQFNGKFGCLYCYAKGRSLGPGRFVYPLAQCYKRLRTDAELRQDMMQAFDTRKIVHGVKNVSSLTALPLFNISKGVVVDAMHAVFIGAIKQYTKIILKETQSPYYVGSPVHQKSIDEYLLKIRPPSCRSRKPRSISTYLKWKASEWRNWLDYAPICLKDVLPIKYVRHLAYLSEAIHYLNSDCITQADLDRSEMLLKKYVRLFQKYFGLKNMTSNIHLLTHLVETVRNWGPIWVHEAFIFESWNKRIMDLISSPHARTNQVATRFLMHKFIITSMYDETVSQERRKFISKILKMSMDVDRVRVKNRVIGLGKSVTRLPTENERVALMNIGYTPLNIKCFNKMTLNGTTYECINEKNCKFCNSTVYGGNGIFGSIVSIITFSHNNETTGGIFIRRLRHVNYAFSTQFINAVTLSDEFIFIKESELIKPAVQISASNKLYVIKQANCWETD